MLMKLPTKIIIQCLIISRVRVQKNDNNIRKKNTNV